jgi:hypothetical protein
MICEVFPFSFLALTWQWLLFQNYLGSCFIHLISHHEFGVVGWFGKKSKRTWGRMYALDMLIHIKCTGLSQKKKPI